uniref:Tyrosine-protein kinase n=1 Tax=Echinococcus granulosus TaxID=6210 RepID=A0A068WLW7_ECHGR|nr:tyrosine protein kinase Src64B [Echinococcus granulosus]
MGVRRRFRIWRDKRRAKRNPRPNPLPTEPIAVPNPNKPLSPQCNQPEEQANRYAKPTKPFTVQAIYDYVATQPDECSFTMGDLLTVVDNTDDWWLATNLRTQKTGLIPPNYVTSDMSLSNVLEAWYDVGRMGAERKLLMPGVQSGTYIIRPCTYPGSPYCLSVRVNGVRIRHYRVYYNESTGQFYISEATPFRSLDELISHYYSCPVDGEVGLIEARPRRVPPPLSFKDCFISYTDVHLGEELGRGNFGVVYRGHILSMEVAVKKSLDLTNDAAFREEAKVMHKLSHQRIVRFLGFCCDAPDGRVLIITEFMPNGALRDYLQKVDRRVLDYRQLISIIDQVGVHHCSTTFPQFPFIAL